MIRSLYSGVSGLTTHQSRMDVIGNNIANVNTYGFKASRTTFRDIYYQTSISATSGQATYAGNNPAEVGYGVQLGSIDKDMSQSNGQSTNKIWDMMINGDGFFMTAKFDSMNLSSSKPASSVTFTRMGNFGIDSVGNLVAGGNTFVVGSRNSLKGLLSTGDYSNSYLSQVEIKDLNGDNAVSSNDVTYKNTINLNDLVQAAFNVFTDEYGYMYGYDWNAIVAAEGDLTGNDHVVYDFDGTSTEWDALTADEKMQYIDVQQTLKNLNDPANVDDVVAANYRYYCDKNGEEILDSTGARIGYATLYAAIKAATTPDDKDAAIAAANSDGAIIGKLSYADMTSANVSADGTIQVGYNGELKYLARIELAVFDNPDGLSQDGNTSFADNASSGMAKIKKPGEPGAGEVKSKYLEMANVNLANEFSDMIVTQRGFQANARIITTSDSMLEELVNLKR